MDSSETRFVTLLPDGLSLTRLCRDATGRRFLLQADNIDFDPDRYPVMTGLSQFQK